MKKLRPRKRQWCVCLRFPATQQLSGDLNQAPESNPGLFPPPILPESWASENIPDGWTLGNPKPSTRRGTGSPLYVGAPICWPGMESPGGRRETLQNMPWGRHLLTQVPLVLPKLWAHSWEVGSYRGSCSRPRPQWLAQLSAVISAEKQKLILWA